MLLLKAMLQHHLLQHFTLEQFEKKVENKSYKTKKKLFIIFSPFTLLIVHIFSSTVHLKHIRTSKGIHFRLFVSKTQEHRLLTILAK